MDTFAGTGNRTHCYLSKDHTTFSDPSYWFALLRPLQLDGLVLKKGTSLKRDGSFYRPVVRYHISIFVHDLQA
jgi:hypothetical protein